jgi:hypothetical protein
MEAYRHWEEILNYNGGYAATDMEARALICGLFLVFSRLGEVNREEMLEILR